MYSGSGAIFDVDITIFFRCFGDKAAKTTEINRFFPAAAGKPGIDAGQPRESYN
jgi:hypothetical protein